MADYNKWLAIGRLTQDPEIRYTGNGIAVSDLRLATSREFTTKDGEKRKTTLYIDVTVWKATAENCCKYLAKGSQIFVEGYLIEDSWDDKKTGEKRSKIKVEADRVQFLDSKPRDDEGGYGGREEPQRGPRERASWGGAAGSNGGGAPPARYQAPPPGEDEDQDIPFGFPSFDGTVLGDGADPIV